MRPGGKWVAVAIRARGKIVGTMSVAAPLTRLPESRIAEILPMLRAAADNTAIAWESARPSGECDIPACDAPGALQFATHSNAAFFVRFGQRECC
jgi:hypothetical protein